MHDSTLSTYARVQASACMTWIILGVSKPEVHAMHATRILRCSLSSVLRVEHAARVRCLLRAVEALVRGRRLTLTDLARSWPGFLLSAEPALRCGVGYSRPGPTPASALTDHYSGDADPDFRLCCQSSQIQSNSASAEMALPACSAV